MDAEPSATKPAVVAIAPEAWRAVLAALVNPRLRGALAEAITEGDPALTAAERRDARRILTRSGLLTPGGQLSWIAERLMGTDEVLAEKPFTLKLFAFTTDPNTLRRALVDTGLIDRNADGTDYRRVAGAI